MLYFIPAWYKGNSWSENEQIWYTRRERSEMDDTVKQIQLFSRKKVYPFQVLLLSFAPNFRHFLHRQSIYHVPRWSCFDAMCGITSSNIAVRSFHDLDWPDHIEFIYSPFTVSAVLDGLPYARIEFGEDGNMIQVLHLNGTAVASRDIYDDRGFLSCGQTVENGKVTEERYFSDNGIWKLLVHADSSVEVNPDSAEYIIQTEQQTILRKYEKNVYNCLDEVIAEVLRSWLEQTDSEDMFCIAMHSQHNELLQRLLTDRKTILSFFGSRLLPEQLPCDMLEQADYIVVDSRENLKQIVQTAGKEYPYITDISPYDTRVDFGISSQLREQKILLPVDHVSDELLEQLVIRLTDYMQINKSARVHLFTRNAFWNRKTELLEKVQNILQKNNRNPDFARKEEGGKRELNPDALAGEGIAPILFRVEQCVDELSVSRCLREQRLLLEQSDVPDLFLQISAISMGIPQILKTVTPYIVDGKNGRVLKTLNQLEDTLAWYLNGMKHWNEAVVASYELGKLYSTERLIEKWRKVIEKIERDNGTPAGNGAV